VQTTWRLSRAEKRLRRKKRRKTASLETTRTPPLTVVAVAAGICRCRSVAWSTLYPEAVMVSNWTPCQEGRRGEGVRPDHRPRTFPGRWPIRLQVMGIIYGQAHARAVSTTAFVFLPVLYAMHPITPTDKLFTLSSERILHLFHDTINMTIFVVEKASTQQSCKSFLFLHFLCVHI